MWDPKAQEYGEQPMERKEVEMDQIERHWGKDTIDPNPNFEHRW